MAGALLLIVMIAPAAAAAGCVLVRVPRVAEGLNLIASLAVCAAAIPLTILSARGPYYYLSEYIIIDIAGAWVILCTAIVYLLASIYSIGYMRLLGEDEKLWGFYALFAGFALTILLSAVMNNAGLYWIAIELTTLVSTFLVGFERAAESIEAAWKYIIIISAGISLALLGTVLFYWCGSFVLGQTYDMTWEALRDAAPKMNPALALLSFFLVLVGYGTKVGLAPMHTWLPDAHSESPAPISAMLSGALLNTAMLGIVRYLAIANAAQNEILARKTLVAFGVLSLIVGALFIVRQNGIKRLMAYSSVEHMGIVALGFGIGGPLGIAGALYHMLNHSLNKSLMFFGAGNAMRSYGSKEIRKIRYLWAYFPMQGALWLAGAVAITGAPPFGLFLSELVILRAGFERGYDWAVYAMAVLLIVIFIGFLNHFRAMYFDAAGAAPEGRPAQISRWCVVPMWLALVPLVVFGVWWPSAMWDHFAAAAHTLTGAAP
ncbi:MAG TPA: proton-conducting transporter membrane subunit [Xanthobacteraceae bacterium]|nr:proton-conducting transporter membrane subunit [Xanthobacteraceae bacterium]